MEQKPKKSSYFLPAIIGLSLAIGLIFGHKIHLLQNSKLAYDSQGKQKLNKLLDFIESEYVDSINTDSVVDITVSEILSKLDPHSTYIPKSELANVSESMEGKFIGIGINFYMYKDSVTVIKPIPNGPSDKAGIKAGDRILYANGIPLFNKKLTTQDLFKILKGKPNTKVNLTVYRKSQKKTLKIAVDRNEVPIKSVEIALKLNSNLGYIKVNRFAETTAFEFKKALSSLKTQKVQGIVVDLTNNGGGYMDAAVKMVDEFLTKGKIIVRTKNKKGKVDTTIATEGGVFETAQLYVLVNENSASASEIFAGAVQDNDRGVIIGRRTFGKGLVQREMKLDDGSAVRLTIARYYTPSGRSIQKPYTEKEAYENDFEKRFASGELFEKDSIKVADSLKFKTTKGRVVYGGGGIVPDWFVPLEKDHNTEGIEMLFQLELLSYFAFEQIDANRAFFEKQTKESLKQELVSNPVYVKKLENYLKKNGLIFNLSTQKKQLTNYLFAEFSKQLFNETIYYETILPQNKMIQKILSKLP